MSGFFESLAARARGEAPVVRPRLPGIFESAQGQEFEQSEVFAPVEMAAPELAAPAAAAALEVRKTPDRSEAVVVPTPTPVAEHLPLPATPRRSADAPIAAAAPPRTIPQAVEAVQVASKDPAAPPVTTPALAVPRPPRRDDPPPPAMGPVVPPMPLAAAVVRPVSAPTSPAAALPTPPSRPSPRDIVPRVARARPQQPPPPAAPRQEETTVHVSIGRIEVRAVQPTPEARPREKAKPAVMSLDEYLRSRRERR